jgi:hypothetical protein
VYHVAIVFKDGSKVTFYAQEFDVDLHENSLVSPDASYDEIHKFTYKDWDGNNAPLYLNPTQVAGIAVARAQSAAPGLKVN